MHQSCITSQSAQLNTSDWPYSMVPAPSGESSSPARAHADRPRSAAKGFLLTQRAPTRQQVLYKEYSSTAFKMDTGFYKKKNPEVAKFCARGGGGARRRRAATN